MEAHGYKPRLTAPAVEQGGHSIVEFLCIPYCLFHCLRHIQPLNTLDFNMYPSEAGQVRHITKGQRTAPLDLIS